MPRGKKKTALQTIEEQIQKTDADIAKYQDKIKELETEKEQSDGCEKETADRFALLLKFRKAESRLTTL